MAKLRSAKDELASASPRETVALIQELADPASLTVGAAEFKLITNAALSFVNMAETAEQKVKAGLVALEQLASAQFISWRTKEAAAQTKIDAKRRELEALKVSFDMLVHHQADSRRSKRRPKRQEFAVLEASPRGPETTGRCTEG